MLQQFACLGWRIIALVIWFAHGMNVRSFLSIPDYSVNSLFAGLTPE
jgi:hypothetical protein